MKELNLVVLGASRSGKTQLITRYTQHTFSEAYTATIEDRYTKETSVDGSFNLLKILDTQGIEQFRDRREVYIRNADGFVLVYDTTSVSSLSELEPLTHRIKALKPHSPVVVAGTKTDKRTGSSDAIRSGAKLAASIGSPHILTSARETRQIETVFETVVQQQLKQQPYRSHMIGPSSASSSASIDGWVYSPSERGIPRQPPTLKRSMLQIKKSVSKLRPSKSMLTIRKAISTASFAKSPGPPAKPTNHMTPAPPGCRPAQPTTETTTQKTSARSGTEPVPTLRYAGGGEEEIVGSGIHTVTQSNLSERPEIADVSEPVQRTAPSGTCAVM